MRIVPLRSTGRADTKGRRFAVNPAFVSRVYNDDDISAGTTRIRIVDDQTFDESGRVAAALTAEDVTVVGNYEQVLQRLQYEPGPG